MSIFTGNMNTRGAVSRYRVNIAAGFGKISYWVIPSISCVQMQCLLSSQFRLYNSSLCNCTKYFTKLRCPASLAKCKAVFPMSVRDVKTAPNCSSRLTISLSPIRDAMWIDFSFSPPLTRAPDLSKSVVMSTWPASMAAFNALFIISSHFTAEQLYSNKFTVSFLTNRAASVSGYSPSVLQLLKLLPALNRYHTVLVFPAAAERCSDVFLSLSWTLSRFNLVTALLRVIM